MFIESQINTNQQSITEKINTFFPVEIQDIILCIHYKGLYNSVINQLKREKKSAFDTCSINLLRLIKGTGTFQRGHFDLSGKNHEISIVRRGHIVSPLDIRLSVVSKKILENKLGNEMLTFIEQMKDENQWTFDSQFLYRFDPCVIDRVMNMV